MWTEFKKFVMRGNVVDLAVGIILGASFNKIVASFVGDIVMPLVGMILGRINISALVLVIGPVHLKYGSFLQNVLDFILTAFGVFIIVKAINRLNNLKKAEVKKLESIKKESREVELLTEIRNIISTNFSEK